MVHCKASSIFIFLFVAGAYAYTMESYDDSVMCSFGELPIRVFYPEEVTGKSYVIHVSRGGSGMGDDRAPLAAYVSAYVQSGYVVVTIDHRNAGFSGTQIAQYRGEEISCVSEKIATGEIAFNGFSAIVDGSSQGYAGHSGGCQEGLEAAGLDMEHGDYCCPAIKAVYGMSPAGYEPDQFGITTTPPGFSGMAATAVFVILGEQEKDINGPGTFMATDWRLQAYRSMNVIGPRFQAYASGPNTTHMDIAGDNPDIQKYNADNSLALFDTYVRGIDRRSEIGMLAMPAGNRIDLSQKGTGSTSSSQSKLLNSSSNLQAVYINHFSKSILVTGLGNAIKSYSILTVSGKVVQKGQTQCNRISIASLYSGMFLVRVTTKKQNATMSKFHYCP